MTGRGRVPAGRWVAPVTGAGVTTAVVAVAGLVAFLVAGATSGPLDWAELLTSPAWDPARGQFGA
ncbi:MAG: ABC transporter permease, partial [Acidimicrobiales bacterium]